MARFHGGEVIPEEPPRGESQSNGAVEQAVKIVKGFARVLKEQLEDKANMNIETAEPAMLWLIRWAAMLPSRYLVGKDGQTPIERRRGRKCGIEVFPYGETVWYKELRDTKDRRNQLETSTKRESG